MQQSPAAPGVLSFGAASQARVQKRLAPIQNDSGLPQGLPGYAAAV